MKVYVQCIVFLMLVIYGESVKFLPTLSDEKAVEIISCVSNSCNQGVCDTFKNCFNKMTKRVYEVDQKCLNKYYPDPKTVCDATHTLYPSDDVAKQIFKCIGDSLIEELSEKENEEMKAFETCGLDAGKQCQALPKCPK